MRLRRWAGLLTRILLLVPLAAGTRADCGASGTHSATVAEPGGAPDCHDASGPAHEHGGLPAAPSEPSGGPLSGHCPAYHSCALDFSFLAQRSGGDRQDPTPAPAPRRAGWLVSPSPLPEVPPPRV